MPHVLTVPAGDPGVLSDAVAIDHFIRARAPSWLKSATPEALTRLHHCLGEHHDRQAQVARLLAGIEPLDRFAVAMLQGALGDLLGTAADFHQALWREMSLKFEFPAFRITDVDLPTARLYPRDSNFLPRVLQNFTAPQAEAGYYYAGAGIVENGRLLALSPERVATLCRTLDLGKQYQRHLKSVLEPEETGARQRIVQLLADDHRCALEAQACYSHLKGDIDDPAFQQLLVLTQDAAAPGAAPPGQWRRVQVLGFTLIGALVMEMDAQAGFILYLPNDPRRPLRQQASLQQLAAKLAADLNDRDYFQYFTRQFSHDDRPGFLAQAVRVLARAQPDLDLSPGALWQVGFAALAQEKIDRIKADAGVLAVPTAGVDDANWQHRLKALESAGLSSASALAWFVPGLAELMLVSLIKDVLGEVYEGVDDWSHGQRDEAVDHLLALMGSLALGAVMGTGATMVSGAITRNFVDRMVPVLRNDGSTRLWHWNLASYQSPLTLASEPHSDGLWRDHGREWWCRGQQVFEVREDELTGRRQIVHPLRQAAYAPELIGNDDGAWWVVGEHPLHWQGVPGMLRRMGPRSAGLHDEACSLAADVAEVDEAMLRGLLVERRPMPPRLVSALERFTLDGRVNQFFRALANAQSAAALDQQLCEALRRLPQGAPATPHDELAHWKQQSASLRVALFEHLAALKQPELDPAGQALKRSFPGLPANAIEALMAETSSQQRVIMECDGRIPLALLEQSRWHLAQWRSSRALEGLCLRNTCDTDCVRLVFALLRREPGWPQGLSFELREGSLSGRVVERQLPTSEATEVRVLLNSGGVFEVADDQGRFFDLREGSGSVFEAIVGGLSAQQCLALGLEVGNAPQALRRLLRERGWAVRQQLGSILGLSARPPSFRAPQCLADRRIGYLLSGRGGPGTRSLTTLVRALFPGFNDLEASVFLDQLHARNLDPMGELLRYQRSLEHLDRSLGHWERQATIFARAARRRVSSEIRRCWCRQNPPVFDNDGRILGYRLRLDRIAVGDLPEFPAEVDFSHVVDLSLCDAGQSQRVNGFLGRFSNLRWLDLSYNACPDIPLAIRGMSELEELVLSFNEIRLTDQSNSVLGSLSRLEVLYMDNNPLGRAPDLTSLHRLRRLSLRRTDLRTLPEGLLTRSRLEMVDLRGNQLITLPDGFFQASLRVRDATLLHGNPLLHEVRTRLWELVDDQQLSMLSANERRHRHLWLTDLEGEVLATRGNQWDSLRHEADSEAFFKLLGELLGTPEYRYEGARLRERVWQMLEAATENTELRERLFQAAAVPLSCVDSVIANFSNLEVSFLVFNLRAQAAAGQQQKALLRFARGLFRLDRLEQHVRSVIAQRVEDGRSVDEIEISLAYRIRLARDLELPGQPHYMEFADIAGVSPRHAREAARVVRAEEATDALAEFIATRDFWVDYLREQHPAQFSEMEDRYWALLDAAVEKQESISEGAYVTELNQVAADRDAALNAVALRLTRDALSLASAT